MDVVGIIGVASGVAIGVGALYYAHTSKRIAEEARDIARRSEEHAVEATGVARDSNRVAVDAKQLAEEANEISLRSEARDTERHDVTWELDWEEAGTFTLTNTGTDEAVWVRATVSVDEWKVSVEQERVAGGGFLTLVLPEAAQEFAREVVQFRLRLARQAEQRRRYQANPLGEPLPLFGFESGTGVEYMHRIGYRVDWETPLGRHRTEDPQNFLAPLGEHEDLV